MPDHTGTERLRFDAEGNPHLLYNVPDSQTLYYSRLKNGYWQTEPVQTDPKFQIGNPSIRFALDDDGQAHVLFAVETGDGSEEDLIYGTRSQGTWVTSVVESAEYVFAGELVVDHLGTVHRLSERNEEPSGLILSRLTGTGWSSEHIDGYSITGDSMASEKMLLCDDSSRLWVIYRAFAYDFGEGAWYDKVKFAYKEGGVWRHEVIDSWTDSIEPNAIDACLDSNGMIHVFYARGDERLLYHATRMVPGPEPAMIVAAVDATATIDNGVLTIDPFGATICAQTIDITSLERRMVMEFPLSDIPDRVEIASAWLHVSVNSVGYSGNYFPLVEFMGYAGNGVIDVADVYATGNRVGSVLVTALGDLVVEINPVFVGQLLEAGASHLGLLGLSATSNGPCFYATEASYAPYPPTLEITYPSPPPVPGDCDGDGDVDLDDFVIFKKNYGQTGVTAGQGDLDGDGDVDLDDFVILKKNFAS